jgi:hypothetical protein
MNQAGLFYSASPLHAGDFGVGHASPQLLATQWLPVGTGTQPHSSGRNLNDIFYRRGTLPSAGAWFALKGDIYGSANAHKRGAPRGVPHSDNRG